MKVGQFYQQGDVIIKKIERLPEGLKPMDSKILQESETTGHHHHFKPTAAVDLYTSEELQSEEGISTITPNFGKFIVVREDETLFHGKGFEENPADNGTGDHHALTIPPGVYEIDIVREYNYDTNEAARVVD